MTPLQLANCSMFVPRRRETLVARWPTVDTGQSCRWNIQCRGSITFARWQHVSRPRDL